MKNNKDRKPFLLLLLLALGLLLCGCSAAAPAAGDSGAGAKSQPSAAPETDKANVVTVSTVDQLLTALAPDTAIILQPGDYELTAAAGYGDSDSGSKYYGWSPVDDQQSLLELHGLTGLELWAAQAGAVTLGTEANYASVIQLSDCEDIALHGLTLSHPEDTELGAGILQLQDCGDVLVEGCTLQNSRSYGLAAVSCRELKLKDTAISDCKTGAAILVSCWDSLLDGCTIRGCGSGFKGPTAYSLLCFETCDRSAVINSAITGNNNIYLVNAFDCSELYLGGLDVRGNELESMFYFYPTAATVYGCSLSDNAMTAGWYSGSADSAKALSPEGQELEGDALAAMSLVKAVTWSAAPDAAAPTAAAPVSTAAPAAATVRVSTVDQLLAAIAPNTELILEKGVYDLSTAKDYGVFRSGSEYYRWEQGYDGMELQISGVDGLSITAADPGEVTIATKPSYADVLAFYDCERLQLRNLTVGHTQEPGMCSGGVLYLSDCEDVDIGNCRLYGCGIVGVTAYDCDTVTVKDTDIYDCSYAAVSVDASRYVQFDNCDVYDCQAIMSALINFTGSSQCAYINSELHDNSGNGLVYAAYTQGLRLASLDVHDNKLERMFYFSPYAPSLSGCAFARNTVEKWYGSIYEPTESVMAIDSYSQPLDEAALRGMSLGGSIVWVPQAPETVAPPLKLETAADGAVHVSDVNELLAAIAPDTTIYMEAGTYDLSQAGNYGYGSGAYYSWVQDYDGPELVISGVSDLTITGAGADKVTISAAPRYADVLCFMDCEDLSLSGFTAGHTEAPGSCSGGVLYFGGCEDVRIESCALFGCGIIGISAFDCDEMDIVSTEIYDCSNGGVYFDRCNEVAMTACDLHDNGGPDYSLYMCSDMTVDGKPMPKAY